MKHKPLYIAVLVILIVALFLVYDKIAVADTHALASCLAEKGVVMYGSQYCPHCHKQQEMFGDDFSLIEYHDCSIEQDLCIEKGITGVPTWVFADGNSVSGTQQLATLAKIAECPI